MRDEEYMAEALKLAKKGQGRTSPNPMVGAVIVKDGKIVGRGYHKKAGEPHAEIFAINEAKELAKDATLYVTLEPCAHYGRTGPCAEAVIKANIKRVVAAMKDPNPKVAGKGIKMLGDAGIEVDVGVLEDDAKKLNRAFLKWITTGLPFVILKTAMTLDGKIATKTGESKWITGEVAREKVHELRNNADAIIVGINTVIADNPSLTTRLRTGKSKNPIRVILDSKAKIPLNSKVLTDGEAKTIVVVAENADEKNVIAIESTGAEVVVCGKDRVDIKELLKILGSREITSLLVEGGGEVNYSFIEQKLFDRVYAFIAPKILGGRNSRLAVAGEGFDSLSDAVLLSNMEVEKLGVDILITGDRYVYGDN